jgi:dienelactone hydrolase
MESLLRSRSVPLALTALALFAAGTSAQEVSSRPVPAPTGPHRVGTTVWHWSDPTRSDEFTSDPEDVREVMVQAWYPAAPDSSETPAPYAPLDAELAAYRSWSYPAARIASVDGTLPVVLIAPGRGIARYRYSGIAEDLASHGYFVVGVDSPHSGRVTYPDGRFIPPAERYRVPIEVLTGPYARVDEFFEEAAALGSQDLLFVLERLAELNRNDPARRFVDRLDLTRMGLFGHSLGGRIGGAAVGTDPRFVAFASMEGVPPPTQRRGGMDAAVLMLVSTELPAMAQPNIREVIPPRRSDVWIATLEGFGHNSVTDLPHFAPDGGGYEVEPVAGMEAIRNLLRLFFDEYVRERSGIGQAATTPDRVTLEVFRRP